MWLVTVQGFYSVVAHRGKPDHVLVRCREEKDLLALRAQAGKFKIRYDDRADYPYRAVLTRARWEHAVAELSREIDYDNFKNAVGARQGYARAGVYHRVWDVLLELQRYRDGRERTVFGMIAGRGRPREDRSWARDVAWRDVDDTLWPDDIDGPRWLGIDDLDPDGDLPLGDTKNTKE
jgi:hypothetical protein